MKKVSEADIVRSDESRLVDELVSRSREAQSSYEANGSQSRYDRACLAAGWAIMEPERNRILAELAVESTGLGNVQDKIAKNFRKTLGLLRDLREARTFGVLRDDPAEGITEIARPVGVVGAVTPSTNPAATPANNAINALKGGNAIILSPSPKGSPCCGKLVSFIHEQFDRIGEDRNLVSMLPAPASKANTQRLMETVDLIVATGSRDNVRRAYSSGTPALGVGVGNAPVIVDETADLEGAAKKISASKRFDNATSCSSENALIVVDSVFDDFLSALSGCGGALAPSEMERSIVERMWPGGRLNPAIMAKDSETVVRELGLESRVPEDAKFVLVETDGIGNEHPLSGEKLSLVAALYRAENFEGAVEIARRILAHQGAGHSVGLHSALDERARLMAERLPVCRVIVNQAHCFATGGSFDNASPFSLSMGCGTRGGNSIDENLHWKHFIQRTRIVRPIPSREPTLEEIFSDYWAEAGKK